MFYFFVKRYWRDWLLIFFVLTANSLILLLSAKIIEFFYKNINFLQKFSSNYFSIIISIFFILAAVSAIFFYRLFLVASLSEKISFDLRRIFFKKILSISPQMMEEAKSYGLPSVFTADVMYAQTSLMSALSSIYSSGLIFFGALFVMIFCNFKYTLIFFMFIFLATIPLYFGGKLVKDGSSDSQYALGQLSSFIGQYVGRFKTVISNAQYQKEILSFEEKINQVKTYAIKKYKILSVFSAGIVLSLGVSIFFLASIIVNDLISNAISLQTVATFLFYMALCGGAIVNLIGVYGDIQSVRGAFSRVKKILEIPDVQDFGSVILKNIKCLAFQNVSYRYPGASEPVFENFSFHIGRGDAIALTGRSGIGKSTIIDLIVGMITPDSGRVLASEVNLSEINRQSYLEKVAVVFQQVDIIPGSILDNISYGVSDFDLSDINRAAEISGAKNFVSSLPNGYHTLIGEGNLKLSGGQAQMIAIARALVKNPDLLILDESTNAIDEKNELNIIKNIREHLNDKMLIHVTHKVKNLNLYTDVMRI